jgi:hypothetical protein
VKSIAEACKCFPQAGQAAPENGMAVERTGGMAAMPLSDVATALLRRLWAELQVCVGCASQ